MLKILRRGQKWILWVVIVFVGGAFVFFLGLGRGGRGGAAPAYIAVDVDGRQYDARDLDRIRSNLVARYRQLVGDDFDPEATADFIDQQAAAQLVEMGILAREGEALGLRVSDREVRAALRRIPGTTDEEGRVREDEIVQWAERNYGTLLRFQEWLRDEILAQKTARLIRASIAVSEAEAREAILHRQEDVQVAYVVLDPEALARDATFEDEEVEAFLAENAEQVQALYDERAASFDQDEEVRARHILIRVPQGEGIGPEEADRTAREAAVAARARIEAGESFEDVAEELSEDPGSKDRGGDLGFFPRGRMVKPFEDAAFSLPVGELGGPVKSVHGWHVIRVEEKREAKTTTLEEARPSLALELLRRRVGTEAAEDLRDKLLARIAEGHSLTEAARERGLHLERPDPLRRRPDGAIAGLGANQEALAAIFTLTDEAPTPPRAFRFGDRFALFERIGGYRPSDEEIAAQLEGVRKQLLEERQNAFERAWVDARRTELAEDGRLMVNLDAG